MLSSEVAVYKSDWHQTKVPQIVLGGHYLVENYEAVGLNEKTQPDIVVKHNTSCDDG